MKSIDKLYQFLEDQFGSERFAIHSYGYTQGVAIAKLIEAEIADNYMRLPLDANNVPIHVGDKVEWLGGNGVYIVCGAGTLVSLRTHESNCFTINPTCLRIVKPDTLKDLLEEFISAYEAWDDWSEVDRKGARDRMFDEYADRIRELLGGDAE